MGKKGIGDVGSERAQRSPSESRIVGCPRGEKQGYLQAQQGVSGNGASGYAHWEPTSPIAFPFVLVEWAMMNQCGGPTTHGPENEKADRKE